MNWFGVRVVVLLDGRLVGQGLWWSLWRLIVVGDIGSVAIVVGNILDYLDATIGKCYLVLTIDTVVVLLLLMGKVIAGRLVLDGVGEGVVFRVALDLLDEVKLGKLLIVN
jgi:hypothetical protein